MQFMDHTLFFQLWLKRLLPKTFYCHILIELEYLKKVDKKLGISSASRGFSVRKKMLGWNCATYQMGFYVKAAQHWEHLCYILSKYLHWGSRLHEKEEISNSMGIWKKRMFCWLRFKIHYVFKRPCSRCSGTGPLLKGFRSVNENVK